MNFFLLEDDQMVRSLFRMTSFNPDQISLTAHTLMSTNPSGKAIFRAVVIGWGN